MYFFEKNEIVSSEEVENIAPRRLASSGCFMLSSCVSQDGGGVQSGLGGGSWRPSGQSAVWLARAPPPLPTPWPPQVLVRTAPAHLGMLFGRPAPPGTPILRQGH